MNRSIYGSRKNGIPLSNKILMTASIICVIAAVIVFVFFSKHQQSGEGQENVLSSTPDPETQTASPTPDNTPVEPIVPSASIISQRFNPPAGYTRTSVNEGSFGEYLRNFPLRDYAVKPLVYDTATSALVNDENAPAVSVLALDLINKGNLQLSANSMIRLYAEYLYSQGRYTDISFNLLTTPIFTCDFKTWSEGGRLKVEGNQISWCIEHTDTCGHKDVELGTSQGTFRYYLQNVMTHSNTSSLTTNMNKISADSAAVGDVIIYAESDKAPEIIVDMAEKSDGSKLYIAARGGSPASEIYIVRNEQNADINPWRSISDLPLGAAVYRFR